MSFFSFFLLSIEHKLNNLDEVRYDSEFNKIPAFIIKRKIKLLFQHHNYKSILFIFMCHNLNTVVNTICVGIINRGFASNIYIHSAFTTAAVQQIIF
jgi:hypothetical protein